MIKYLIAIISAFFLGIGVSAQSIEASEIIAKAKAGDDVVYEGVTIVGDVDFTPFMDRKDDLPKRSWWGSNDNRIENSISGKITFIDCIFRDDLLAYIHDDRSNYTFTSDFEQVIVFENCKFNGDVAFKYSEFFRQASFAGSIFEEDANFKYAEFEEPTDFSGCYFDEDANFKYAEFNDRVSFASTIFESEANFKYLEAKRDISMAQAKFEGPLNLKYAELNGEVDLTDMEVNGDLDTKYTDINGEEFSKYLLSQK
jgi:hypothetical protein